MENDVKHENKKIQFITITKIFLPDVSYTYHMSH